MASLEEFGRRMDREIERLKRYLHSEVRPATEKRLAAALRAVSARMAKMARELDRRGKKPRAGRAAAK